MPVDGSPLSSSHTHPPEFLRPPSGLMAFSHCKHFMVGCRSCSSACQPWYLAVQCWNSPFPSAKLPSPTPMYPLKTNISCYLPRYFWVDDFPLLKGDTDSFPERHVVVPCWAPPTPIISHQRMALPPVLKILTWHICTVVKPQRCHGWTGVIERHRNPSSCIGLLRRHNSTFCYYIMYSFVCVLQLDAIRQL